MVIDENAVVLINLALSCILALLAVVSIYMAGIKYTFKGKGGLYWFGIFCLCYLVMTIDSCIEHSMNTGSKIITTILIVACVILLIHIAKGIKDDRPKQNQRA